MGVLFQLARMRYATVSEFRGKVLVSIREYYEKDGKMLPGKKGKKSFPVNILLELVLMIRDNSH